MFTLDATKTALVVIDLQEGILPFAGGPHTADDVVSRAARLAEKCRASGSPVVMVRVGWSADFAEALKQPVDAQAPAQALPDNWWTYPVSLGKRDSDIEVTKRQWGAFYGTDLELQLRRRGIDTIILCGISTNIGVESTARNAWELGFNLVGYGCTTCIGNSGPLPEPIEMAIKQGDLTVGAVLSGNRNFEGRIHPLVKTNWLASPPLVVAYALAGNMNINLATDPIGHDRKNEPVYLKDIWPSSREIARAVEKVSTEMFRKEYAEVFEGTAEWKAIDVVGSDTYDWQDDST